MLFPEIRQQLLGLVDVEQEVVLLTPLCQSAQLLSVAQSTQSCVYRDLRIGLRTQT